ncbi:hypothetical protein LHP98_04250 [Rhodobacter sp. Har01]|uniref:hypothetical protein n=1 Tax=Rhodobacter sp. Har01 TaxID=2883999 RepID=UPI001D093B46|nr:hypothetical protein [Rhodobacter sp. Har01]MCB6177339.1 hypothetical protein [Rhodobacter sp. Har01]
MTIRFSEGEAEPDEALHLTEELFRIAVGDLNAELAAIREGQFEQAKAGRVAVRDLVEFSKQVLEGRKNVEKLRKQVAGDVGARGELDLDAARDEIGRRLACLRDARGD